MGANKPPQVAAAPAPSPVPAGMAETQRAPASAPAGKRPLRTGSPAAAKVVALQKTVQSQEEAMQDKDEIIRALYARLELSKASRASSSSSPGEPGEAGAGPSGASSDAGGAASHRMAELIGANTSLRARIQELDLEVVDSKAQIKALEHVQEALAQEARETHALLQAAVERERMLQEARNEKVLKMFAYKDQHAGEVQRELDSTLGSLQSLETELHDVKAKLNASEGRLADALGSRVEIRAELNQSRLYAADVATEMEGLRAQAAEYQDQLERAQKQNRDSASLRAQVLELQRDLEAKDREVERRASEEAGRRLEGLEGEAESARAGAELAAEKNAELVKLLQGQLEDARAALAVHTSGAGTAYKDVAELKRAVQARDADVQRLKECLDHADNELVLKSETVRKLQGAAEEAAGTLEGVKASHARLEKEVEALRRENAKARGQTVLVTDQKEEIQRLTLEIKVKDQKFKDAAARLAKLEELQRTAQITALKSERTLASMREKQSETQLQDAASAQAAAARLTARVTEMAHSERKLTEELALVRERLALKEAELKRQEASKADKARAPLEQENVRPNVPPAAAVGGPPAGDGGRYKKFAEEAEIAVGIIQARYVQALNDKHTGEIALERERERHAQQLRHLEQQIRLARQDGSAKVKDLEDAVQMLSRRDEMHSKVARLSTEVSALRRLNSKLTEDAQVADETRADLRDRLASVSDAWAASRALAEGRSAEADLVDLGQVVIKLASRLEKAEAAGAAAGGAPGPEQAAAAPLPRADEFYLKEGVALDVQERSAELFEASQLHSLEVGRLAYEVEEQQKLITALELKAAEKERGLQDLREENAQLNLRLAASHAEEAAKVSKRIVDLERQLQKAQHEKARALAGAKEALLQKETLQLELDKLKVASLKDIEHLQNRINDLAAVEAAQRRDLAELGAREKEHGIRATAAEETLEALQTGSGNDLQSCVLSLTAQITTVKVVNRALEDRNADFQRREEAHAAGKAELEGALEKAAARCKAIEDKLVVQTTKAGEIRALRAELSAREDKGIAAARDIDTARGAQTAAETQVAVLRHSMESQRNRHFEQLNRERREASSALRECQASNIARELTGSRASRRDAFEAQLSNALSELIASTRDSGVEQWRAKAMEKCKEMVLSTLRQYHEVKCKDKLKAGEIQTLEARARALEQALDLKEAPVLGLKKELRQGGRQRRRRGLFHPPRATGVWLRRGWGAVSARCSPARQLGPPAGPIGRRLGGSPRRPGAARTQANPHMPRRRPPRRRGGRPCDRRSGRAPPPPRQGGAWERRGRRGSWKKQAKDSVVARWRRVRSRCCRRPRTGSGSRWRCRSPPRGSW